MEPSASHLTQGLVDSLVGQVRETMENLAQVNAELDDLTVTTHSPDRQVTVVVAPQGRIVELTLDPRIYRTQDSAGLAAKILDTIERARSEVDERENEIRASVMPDAEALGNTVGFDVGEISDAVLAAYRPGGARDGADRL